MDPRGLARRVSALACAALCLLAVSACTGPDIVRSSGSAAVSVSPSTGGPGTDGPSGTGGGGRTGTGGSAAPSATTPDAPGASGPGASGAGLDPITRHAPDQAQTSITALLPGMYGLAELGGRVTGHSVAIATSGHCDFVLDVLAAGQWAMQLFAKPHAGADSTPDSHAYAAIMTLGDQVAIASLDDSAYACTGSVVAERPARLTVSGAAHDTGDASFLPLYCRPVAESDTDVPVSHTVIGLYRMAGASYLLFSDAPAAKGTHRLDPGEDQVVSLARLDPKKPALAQIAKILTLFYDPLSASGGQDAWSELSSFQAWTSQLDDGADTTATATISSTQPFAGTLTAQKLADPDDPSSTVAVDLAFSCDT
jgi:hypothetical protein